MAPIADGKGKLGVRHRHPAGLGALRVGFHRQHLGRGEGGRDEFGRVVAVFHNIDLFAAQLVDDARHPGAAGAYAGTHGIHVFIVGEHRQLGAGAGLPGHGLDLHHAVENLGDLHLEQPLDQAGVGAGDQGLGALIAVPDVHHVYLDSVPFVEHLTSS